MYVTRGRLIKPPRNLKRILVLKKNLTEEEAFRHEIYMIHVLGRKDLGTGTLRNRTYGGQGSSGRVLSQESRDKISISKTGVKASQETRKKLSEALKGKNKGKRHSEESRRKMSLSQRKRKASDSTRRKMSLANRGEKNPFYGKKHSLESRRKMSENSKGEKNPNYGKPRPRHIVEKSAASNRGKNRSPETCKKLSELGKGRERSPETRKKISTAMSLRVGEKNPTFGKSWWYNPLSGSSKFSIEAPGQEWVKGRGDTLKKKNREQK